ncbi:MAG: ATP-grasp domain-containing protein [Bacteroidales bacterium]|nr:ATP-grasp domain-containing protein [Bacteroidales bacterium]
MILLDQPYVSEFLKKTIRDMQLPVFEPSGNIHFDPDKDAFCLSEGEAIRQIRENPGCRIYTNSENAIHWISRNLGFTDLPEKITLFKDKFAFRKLTQAIYPELFFKEIPINSLLETDASSFPYPFVIKPSVGFFSLGVHTVNTPEDWEILKHQIHDEIEQVQHLYPVEVLETASYIAEGYIEGDEYAFDAYFDDAGEPVLLNTWKHYFASREDVSDRVYVTSGEIVLENLERMTGFLKMLAGLVELRNFPLHVEVRIDEQGRMVPIEVNPLRYGGWCTTADNTSNAFGFNAYEYFLKNLKPDWADNLQSRSGNPLQSYRSE